MKLFILLFLFQGVLFAAERDCIKEVQDINLALKISQMWNSDLDWGKKSIEQICKDGDSDIENILTLNKLSHKKIHEEFRSKHTITVEETGVRLEGLKGEVSHDELCVVLDRYVKKWSDCTSPEDYLRSLKFNDYKDFEKICLQKLPEQKKRMIACRK